MDLLRTSVYLDRARNSLWGQEPEKEGQMWVFSTGERELLVEVADTGSVYE